MRNSIQITQRASGCLFGLAFGDALGAETEFMHIEDILRRFPPDGPQAPRGNPAHVTDDTQMALAVGEALQMATRPYTARTLEGSLRQTLILWNESPDNNRAPGTTCIHACENLANGGPWYEATIAHSKGCGANMRVAPVGLLSQGQDGITVTTRGAIAQFQAALTHGHPTALAAADITAATIADLKEGGDPSDLGERMYTYALSQRTIYHMDWLGPLWKRPGINSPEEFIAQGWDECLEALDHLTTALKGMNREQDPCLVTGEGWVAEEAFATGLLCFLLFPDDPIAAIRRAAVTTGDSDSIACIAGAFAGAHMGLAIWPSEWVSRIEYRERLVRLGSVWDT